MRLMTAEDETVVDAFGLVVVEGGELGHGGGFGFVEDGFGHGL